MLKWNLCTRVLPKVKFCLKAAVLALAIMQICVIIAHSVTGRTASDTRFSRYALEKSSQYNPLNQRDLLGETEGAASRTQDNDVAKVPYRVRNRALQQDYSEYRYKNEENKGRTDRLSPSLVNQEGSSFRKHIDDKTIVAPQFSEVYRTVETLSKSGRAEEKLLTPSKPLCQEIPPNLVGKLQFNATNDPTLEETAAANPNVLPGGIYVPVDCVARHRVALIIPHRSREAHLRALLAHLHPILQRQELYYRIFVVHQAGDTIFNKAKLMNAGFLEALKLALFDCVIFHDVDLLPEDDRLLYSCVNAPKHLSVAIDKYEYKLPYASLFGGVTVFTTDQFQDVNGFSNQYWGWGGEDDDMFNRVFARGYTIVRPPLELARYKMGRHDRDKGNKLNVARFSVLSKSLERMDVDGLNAIEYALVDTSLEPLYTNITIDVGSYQLVCKSNVYEWVCQAAKWFCEKYERACGFLEHKDIPPATLYPFHAPDTSMVFEGDATAAYIR